MKCLEKDRTRRYETANGVALDIERHLKHEPVEARPPSTAYRVAKFVRRNQLMVTAGSAVAAALVMGLGLSTWLFFQEQQVRRRAVTAEQTQSQLRQQAEVNAKKAQSEARKSEQVAQFLKEMLRGVGPSVALGRDTTLLKEILDKTAERVGKDLKDSPEVEAELRTTIGDVYRRLYQEPKAAEMYRAVVALSRKLYGNMSTNVADALEKLGVTTEWQGGADDQERMYLEVLTIRTNLLGNEHLKVADALRNLGEVRLETGRAAEAEGLFRAAWAMQQKLGGTNSLDATRCIARLSHALWVQGKLQEAEAPARESLAILERLGADEQVLGWCRGNLGNILLNLGKLDEAETNLRSAVVIEKQLTGPDSRALADWTLSLAAVVAQKGKLEEAEQVGRDGLAISRRVQGTNSHGTRVAGAIESLAYVLVERGELSEAEAMVREELTARKGELESAKVPRPVRWLLTVHADLSGRSGKWKDAAAELLPLVYEELRKLAAHKMAAESAGQTLQPTALVHEAWLRLGGDQQRAWQNRAHFVAAAAEAMRRILIDRARRKNRGRHGKGLTRVDLEAVDLAVQTDDDTLLRVDEALGLPTIKRYRYGLDSQPD